MFYLRYCDNRFVTGIIEVSGHYDCNNGQILENIGVELGICYCCLKETDEITKYGLCKKCIKALL